MDNKKILLVFVAIIVIGLVAAVAVVMGNANTVNVGGKDFNIPEGFVQNESNSEPTVFSGIPVNMTDSFFNKGEDSIFIMVMDCDSQDNAKKIYEDLTSIANTTKTVNNHEGVFYYTDGYYSFVYCEDNYLIGIAVTDESLLEGVVS